MPVAIAIASGLRNLKADGELKSGTPVSGIVELALQLARRWWWHPPEYSLRRREPWHHNELPLGKRDHWGSGLSIVRSCD